MFTRVTLVALLSCLFVQTVAASSFGRTPGNFAVSQTGSAQYSIAIWTPPGPRGIQPQLSLAYDSRGGIGSLGVGWSLSGLGAVTRCNRTYAQDTIPAPVALATSDGYCLNGKRLRLTSGTYGSAGSTYQTEIADFSNVTAIGTAGNGPAYFTVQTRDGRTFQYGFTDANGNGSGSQVLATGTSTASSWLLSKVIDRAGNNYVVNYTTLTGAAVPNTILWTPSSAGASSYLYQMQFNYTSNVPQSSLIKYISGTSVTNAELLSSIAITYSGTVIRDYFLGYQASPTTGRNELISVKECADSAQSNCLLPTSIGYQNGVAGLSTTSSSALTSSGALLTARYDLNGDGIPDLVYLNGTTNTYYVAFGSASGYGTPFDSHVHAGLIGNLTGGKQDGILGVNGTTYSYYLWNGGTSFIGTPTTLPATDAYTQMADVNGDGLPDLVTYTTVASTLTIFTRLNTSSAGVLSFGSLVTAYSVGGIAGAQVQGPDQQYGKLRRYDFNGDGRDDLVALIITGTSGNFTASTYELLSTGSGFTPELIVAQPQFVYSPVFFTNWNDDACTDFVNWNTLYIAGCNGSTPASFPLGQTVLGAIDWDGDGRTDLVVANGSTLGVYLSTGSGLGTLLPTSVPYVSSCQYVTMNANGDGLDDLGCWSQTGSNPLTYYLHNGTGQPPDLVSSISDGYSVTYSPTYVSLSASGGIYTKGTAAAPPYVDFEGPLYVVSSYTSSDGIGATFPTTYSYTGAIVNIQGRGFQGFTTVSTTDSRTGFKDTRTYSTGTLSSGIGIPTNGMLLGESVTQSAGTNVSIGTYGLTWLTLDSTANNQRYFPYTPSSSVDTYEVQVGGSYNGQKITTTAMNYGTPDIYGNFPSVQKTVTDEDSGSLYFGQQWTTTTATTIATSPSTWCNNLPTEQDVTNTSPGVPAITRHSSFTPDYSLCRETQQVVESGSSTYQVTSGLGYDTFGNINSQTVTGVSMAARTTGVNWGTTGQFPTTITNALSQVTHTNFDPNTGQILSIQDPNGITTSWQYDPFARKNTETRPDGTTTTWAYNNCATAGCLNSNNKTTVVQTNVNVGGTTPNIQNTYLDAFDRPLVTSKQMLNGAFDRNEIQYDNMGNVHQQGADLGSFRVGT